MIFLCPKSFSSQLKTGQVPQIYRGFLKFYLSKKKIKAKVCNEVWETFRYEIIENSEDKDEAKNFIANQRGLYEPEEIFLKDHKEILARKSHSLKIMEEKTKNFIERNYADIEVFITENKSNYESSLKDKGILTLSIEEFIIYCMRDLKKREIVDEYFSKINSEI